MATVKCPLGKRGTPSHEWHDGEKSRIYCQGWIDSMTEEYLEACKNCPDHVNKAQDDLDKWNAEHRNNQQIAVQKRLIYAEDLFEPVDFKVFMCGRSGGKTMAQYEALFRKRVELAPTIDPVHAAGACRCHECIYGIRCEDDPLYEGDPDDFRYQCVEGAEYDSVSGLYIGFTSYHSADFFCANGERRNDHDCERTTRTKNNSPADGIGTP